METEEKNNSAYIVKVFTPQGQKYVFKSHAFVVNKDLAKRYSSVASAQRMARKVKDSGFVAEVYREEKLRQGN